ncbi:MAG TPA: hypothetical protein VJZ00_08290, partial [Thermoanaerobaculia bacterium]|nr:hypothetical protein [Thermoanaerobaculia bacterium]
DAEHGIVYRVTRNHPPMISSASEINAQPILAKAFAVRGLRHPQSVIHDEVQDVYFVSTGSGVIARVTPDGRIESPKFIRGLDAPRGMTIVRDVLWVADRDAVRSFDRFTGAPLQTIALAKSGATSLTSIAAGGDELLYVADAGGRIFRIHDDGVAEIVARGEELRSPNALAWDGTRFLIAPALGREVLAWTPGAVPKAVLRGPGAFDGIVVLPTGTVIVSSEHDEALHVSQGNVLRPLFRRAPAPAGIGFDRKRNRLLIPSAEGNWLEAWTLPPLANDDAAVASTSRERALSAEGFRGTSSTTR